ncbi:hypothetical protein TWF594_011325 [Orbilia oligospora]|nr:hypothetical protein TWF594_011325 [Orbilia oligospora]
MQQCGLRQTPPLRSPKSNAIPNYPSFQANRFVSSDDMFTLRVDFNWAGLDAIHFAVVKYVFMTAPTLGEADHN